jgi:prepilin-type N-terminal cleavage/methylation domain-containing protein
MRHRGDGRSRSGFTLVELLVAMIVMAIVGTAAMRLFMSQTRFFDLQTKQRAARAVSRASVNYVMSEMRMVDADAGVAAASATSGASSITLRVPFAVGLACTTSATATTVAFLPIDSVALRQAALTGYAYRTTSGSYTYLQNGAGTGAGVATACTGNNVGLVPGGAAIAVTPAMPASVTAGTPVLLFQRVRYFFGPSATFPGRIGLWRTLETPNSTQELAAPYDTSSRFRFYRNVNDTSDVSVPPLDEVRGVELVFNGQSEKPRQGRTAPELSLFRTSVFFTNRKK